ncbi:MAG: hypothetical protein HKM89_10410 [Gemmatimonadales bacterium]|nr:hypothetical protein [Gemmatimonadales bacterium]
MLARTTLAWIGFAAMAVAAPETITGQTVPTNVMVRVTAHDAKIIGTDVGGARVTLRDAETGQVLAEGIQQGSTGNTRLIMVQPRKRGARVYDTGNAAGFLATIDLGEPILVEIIAEGPLGTPHATQRASKTMLLVPGKDVLGEGVVIDLLGFTVVVEEPSDGASVEAGKEFEIRANVTMLCGCPTEPGGMWDANEIEIVAMIKRGDRVLTTVPLAFAGQRNTYTTMATVDEPGPIEIQVLAMDPGRANFGQAIRLVAVVRE